MKHYSDDFRLGGLDLKSVHEKDHVHGHKTNPFVPVLEWVVLHEAEALTSSQGAEVGERLKTPPMSGAGKGRLEEAIVSDSWQSPVLLHLIVMGSLKYQTGKPSRFVHERYLANSRRAFRYLLAVRS